MRYEVIRIERSRLNVISQIYGVKSVSGCRQYLQTSESSDVLLESTRVHIPIVTTASVVERLFIAAEVNVPEASRSVNVCRTWRCAATTWM